MKISIFLIFAMAVLQTSCSTLSQNQSGEDLLIPKDQNLSIPNDLTAQESKRDLQILRFALNRAYGGRKYVPQVQLDQALQSLSQIEKNPSTDPKKLCQEIDESLLKITDFHLMARLDSNRCSPLDKTRFKKGSVGKNINSNRVVPWLIKYTKIKGKKVALIGINSFPNHEDQVWKGFSDAFLKAKHKSQAIVIDIRGNGGGDDSTGKIMASFLYGQDFPSPIYSQIKSQTPETMAIMANSSQLKILRLKLQNKEIPDFLYRKREEALKKMSEAKEGKIPEETEVVIEQEKPFDPSKGYSKPIFILIDGECESSCESIVEFFENHPHAKTIGENTGGFVHFGNMGIVLLPSSKIVVQMATDYWKFRDGRFMEGVGYAPKIKVPPGKDAMEEAKNQIKLIFTAVGG